MSCRIKNRRATRKMFRIFSTRCSVRRSVVVETRAEGGSAGRQTGNGPKKIFLRFCVSKTRSRSPGPRPFSPGPKRINYVRGPSRLFRNSVKYSARVVWGRPNTHTLGGGQEQRPKINTYEIYQSRDNGGGRVGTRTDD